MGRISEIFNFDNIGGKIKNLTEWSCWITILLIWIAAPIAFFVLVADEWMAEFCWIPFVGAIVGPVSIWLISWPIYAFGEFVEDTHAIRNIEETVEEETVEEETVEEETVEEETNDSMVCRNRQNDSATLQTTLTAPQTFQTPAKKCVCGERFYGDTCPNCGRERVDSEEETNDSVVCRNRQNDSATLQTTLSAPQTFQTPAKKCVCGERFYGDTCPNCGRERVDSEENNV